MVELAVTVVALGVAVLSVTGLLAAKDRVRWLESEARRCRSCWRHLASRN